MKPNMVKAMIAAGIVFGVYLIADGLIPEYKSIFALAAAAGVIVYAIRDSKEQPDDTKEQPEQNTPAETHEPGALTDDLQ